MLCILPRVVRACVRVRVCVLGRVMLYTKANIYSLCVQKSGPSCSALWKRQVSFYLITAPRTVGLTGHQSHSHQFKKVDAHLSVLKDGHPH